MIQVSSIELRRVVIVDDDPDNAEEVANLVSDSGYQPFPITDLKANLEEMLGLARSRGNVLVCDHRLNVKQSVSYSGASLLAQWIRQGQPGLLLTVLNQTDCDTTIRQHRRTLPVVLPRQGFDELVFQQGLDDCVAELNGDLRPWRRPWRTLVHVLERTDERGLTVLDAILPGWKSHVNVRFPIDLLPESLRAKAQPDSYFFAKVNTGAEDVADLYLVDFELAPPVALEDADV